MKSFYLSVAVCLLAVLAFLCPAPAATYTWIQTTEGSGPYNWNDPTNWTSTPGDFPNGIDAVVVIPHFTVNVDEYNENETIDLNVPITLGTLSVVNSNPAYGDAHNSQYLIVGNGGSLTFQVSTGQANLTEYLDVAYGGGSWNIAAPITLASDTVVNTEGVVSGGISFYNGNGTFSEGIIFSQALSGSGAPIKTGPSGLWIQSTGNSYTGNVDVQQGYLVIASNTSLGTSPGTITLGSAGEIGHLVFNGNATMTEPITLTGGGGDLSPIGTVTMSSIIGGTGTLMISNSNGAPITFTEASNNTYVGQAIVLTPNVNVTSAATVFTGNLNISYGGYVSLSNAANVGGTITVNSPQPWAVSGVPGLPQLTAYGLMSAIGVKTDFLPTLTTVPTASLTWTRPATAPGRPSTRPSPSARPTGRRIHGLRDLPRQRHVHGDFAPARPGQCLPLRHVQLSDSERPGRRRRPERRGRELLLRRCRQQAVLQCGIRQHVQHERLYRNHHRSSLTRASADTRETPTPT